MSEQRTLLDLSFHQEELPPYDAGHATPHAMVRRRVVIRSERGDALFEQTDYGHPIRE